MGDWTDGEDNTDKTEVDGTVETDGEDNTDKTEVDGTGVSGAAVETGADETVETVEAGVEDGTGTGTGTGTVDGTDTGYRYRAPGLRTIPGRVTWLFTAQAQARKRTGPGQMTRLTTYGTDNRLTRVKHTHRELSYGHS